MRNASTILLFCNLVGLGVSFDATAAPAGVYVDPAALEGRRHFQQGVALFNDGNFDGALAEFTASYDAQQIPEVFYNIALSQKALFRYSDAIASLHRYIERASGLSGAKRREVEALIIDMQALLAPVSIEVSVADARVAVDGNVIGLSPLGAVQIAGGTHRLTVTLDGYDADERTLLVTAGAPLAVHVVLKRTVITGKIQLSVVPHEATVRVDKQPVALPALLELERGGHTVVATAPHYRTLRTELGITGGQERTVELRLVADRPGGHIYDKWYFWVPIVVVVGGALGLGLGIGLPDTSPLNGTLPPRSRKLN